MSKSSPSRAAREASAKANGQAVRPVPQGPRPQHDPQFLQQVQGMLQGSIKPPNEYVTYQLGQLKESQAEFEALSRNIQAAEAQLTQMRVEMQRADGRIDARLNDIRIWSTKPGAASPSETDETAAVPLPAPEAPMAAAAAN